MRRCFYWARRYATTGIRQINDVTGCHHQQDNRKNAAKKTANGAIPRSRWFGRRAQSGIYFIRHLRCKCSRLSRGRFDRMRGKNLSRRSCLSNTNMNRWWLVINGMAGGWLIAVGVRNRNACRLTPTRRVPTMPLGLSRGP